MSDTLTLTIDVCDGKLKPTDQHRRMVNAFLSGRRLPVRFVLSKKTDVRSNEQNALYWAAYVTPIARHTGNDTESVHEFLRDLFLPRRFITMGKREVELRKTTTDLSPKEFSEYLLQVEAWASTELGVMVPDGQMPTTRTMARSA